MKMLRRLKTVVSAENINDNVTFYYVTLDDAKEFLKQRKANLIVQHQLAKNGWRALNFDQGLYGSKVIDNILYICDNNGELVNINGDEYEPEELLDYFSPEELKLFMKPATPQIVDRNISEYEIYLPPIDDVALELLQDGEHFSDIVKAVDDAYPDIDI